MRSSKARCKQMFNRLLGMSGCKTKVQWEAVWCNSMIFCFLVCSPANRSTELRETSTLRLSESPILQENKATLAKPNQATHESSPFPTHLFPEPLRGRKFYFQRHLLPPRRLKGDGRHEPQQLKHNHVVHVPLLQKTILKE